jgi:hypothetical protein
MITIEKLKEFEAYKGFYDGFYTEKVATHTNINNGEDWSLIADLLQNFKFIVTGMAGDDVIAKTYAKLGQCAEDPEIGEYMMGLARRI